MKRTFAEGLVAAAAFAAAPLAAGFASAVLHRMPRAQLQPRAACMSGERVWHCA